MLSLVGFTLVCVIFVSLGQIIDLVRHCCCGVRTVGKIIRLEESETSEGGPVYSPVVEYLVDGQRRRIKSLIAMAPALYREGQEVPVYYLAGSTYSGRVVTPREFFKWLIVIASCLLFLGLLLASRSAGAP